jgi:hypothetical protein
VHDRLPQSLEHGPGGVDVGRLAAHHDRQNGLDGTGLAPTDRGVEHPQPGGSASLGDPPGGVGPDRAHVDVERARLGVREGAVVAVRHGLDVRGVGQHGDHDVRTADRVADPVGGPPPGLHQPLDRLRGPVVPGHLEPRADQVGGHGPAHDAQSDEAHGRHVMPFVEEVVVAARGSA